MHIQVVEAKAKPTGWANVRLRSSDIPSGTVAALLIVRDLRGPSHLGAAGWQSEKTWIPVEAFEDGEGNTVVELGPDVTRHIGANSNVEIRVSVDGANAFGSGHLIWPAIQQQAGTAKHVRRVAVGGGRRADSAESDPTLLPVPVQPSSSGPEPQKGEEAPAPDPKISSSNKSFRIMGGVVVGLLIIAGILGFFFFDKLPLGGRWTEEVQALKLLNLEEVRASVSEGLPTDEAKAQALEQADLQMKAGNLDAALLLYKVASQSGSAAGSIGMAMMYDPGLHGPKTSPFESPNAKRAVELYEKAANTGRAFAMRRLGILLYEGGNGITADKGKGRAWLEKAVAGGDAEAKTYLETL